MAHFRYVKPRESSRELHQQRFSDCSVVRNLHSGFLLLLQASLWPPKLGFRLYWKLPIRVSLSGKLMKTAGKISCPVT